VLVEWALDEAMTARWNDGLDAGSGKVFEDGVGVVGLVGTEGVGSQVAE